MFLTWIILYLQLRRYFKGRLASLSAIVLCIVLIHKYLYIHLRGFSVSDLPTQVYL